ncbi:MAG: hypothetical protein IPJ49_24970 [Candidatus Obscuribacter sp.]|nr:hypothetical protein [Candidatus Obscuribacter sp.]
MPYLKPILAATTTLFCLWATGVAGAQAADQELAADQVKAAVISSKADAAQDFRRFAAQLEYFTIGNVLYDRCCTPDRYTGSKSDAEIFKQIQLAKYTTDNLLPLLKDPDARVRTLAIAALYSKEDAKILQAIVSLAEDKAQTYPEPQMLAMPIKIKNIRNQSIGGKPGEHSDIPTTKKTVGQIASEVVRFYMERAGYHYGIQGTGGEPGFARYWQERKDRDYCASWYAVKLDRASTGRSPSDQGRKAIANKVRQSIDKLPSPDRYWILLWLASDTGFDLIANREDLRQAMQTLGPKRLMLMLQGKLPSTDPDLKARNNNNYTYKAMQLAVLKDAPAVLKANQVDELLACDKWERDYLKANRTDPLITPWWTIAAAHLAPTRASSLLRGEFARLTEDFYGDQKADLAAALLSLGGSKEQSFLVDVFYDPASLSIKGQYSNFRPAWLNQLSKSQTSINMLKALLQDKRFDSLNDHGALIALSDMHNRLSGTQVITADMRQRAWHPQGVNAACLKSEQAAKAYPKETKELFEQLAIFREALKAHILNQQNSHKH